ncbi:hypothetical protein TRAPUB_3766 [Trametes pubescens]|uniref:DUF6534 domain-containing protein n=1 Tax=Trametes pubescens TaxID=154538 RepID=A0A1M2VCN7_TRAPU|nr:hypothetical protein TRAPUB_3766 [Trametes pubescens]
MYAYPLWVFVTLVTALSLSFILSISLWRTRTGLRHLDRTLNHIIFITFESAALPTACMLASAVIYSIRDAQASAIAAAIAAAAVASGSGPGSPPYGMLPQTLHLDLFFAILTGKVYTLGLLRTLNSRTQFRAGMHTSHLGRRSLTEWDFANAEADAHARGPGGGVGCSWAGSGVGPRGSRATGGAPGQVSRHDGEYRHEGRDESCSSEETVRVSVMDCDQSSIQSIPSAHYTAPKVRKSFSRNPEHIGPRHSVY